LLASTTAVTWIVFPVDWALDFPGARTARTRVN